MLTKKSNSFKNKKSEEKSSDHDWKFPVFLFFGISKENFIFAEYINENAGKRL